MLNCVQYPVLVAVLIFLSTQKHYCLNNHLMTLTHSFGSTSLSVTIKKNFQQFPTWSFCKISRGGGSFGVPITIKHTILRTIYCVGHVRAPGLVISGKTIYKHFTTEFNIKHNMHSDGGHLNFLIKCHLWNRNCLPFKNTWVQPRSLVGFMLLNL
jgi:hypothetical protein